MGMIYKSITRGNTPINAILPNKIMLHMRGKTGLALHRAIETKLALRTQQYPIQPISSNNIHQAWPQYFRPPNTLPHSILPPVPGDHRPSDHSRHPRQQTLPDWQCSMLCKGNSGHVQVPDCCGRKWALTLWERTDMV
jgi:1-acyl-sn-glycerol-3-phosphate acyltransferase